MVSGISHLQQQWHYLRVYHLSISHLSMHASIQELCCTSCPVSLCMLESRSKLEVDFCVEACIIPVIPIHCLCIYTDTESEMEKISQIIYWNYFQIFSCKALLGAQYFLETELLPISLMRNSEVTPPPSFHSFCFSGIVRTLGFEKC